MKKIILNISILLMAISVNAQDWEETGNFLIGGEFLGTTNDFDLDFQRNSMLRMRFQNEATWNGLNGMTANNASRIFCGLNGDVGTAWSVLHFRDGTLSNAMNRDWFNLGTSYTGNQDFMYTGLLERPSSTGPFRATDAVIAWGCNPAGLLGPDNFRILFLSPKEDIPTEGSEAEQGLEVMKITPTGNCGIGDFSSNGFGLNQQPTHRLDVDGQVRIRQMEQDSADVIITGVEQNAVGDYELSYIPLAEFELEDCDWTPIANSVNATEFDIITGIPNHPDVCPEGNVGIGTEPKAKLDVQLFNVPGQTLIPNDQLYQDPVAIHGYVRVDDPESIAVKGENYSDTQNVINSYGGYFRANNAPRNTGLYGVAEVSTGSSSFSNRGVMAKATDAQFNYALYAVADNGTDDWGAWINGKGYISGGMWQTSDESLKTNIQEISNASDIISALTPKCYNYLNDDFEQMALPQGLQYGFLAQELEEVLPGSVTIAHQPESYDEEGNISNEAFDFKAVKLMDLIPILVQDSKEKQTEIDQLNQKMDELEELISQCCAMMDTKSSTDQGSINSIQMEDRNILHQNKPNPFELNTTISYTTIEDGNVKVEIRDAKGTVVEVLTDKFLEANTYEVVWTDPAVERGVYFYSLIINGEEHVKRMIKF